MWFAAQGGASYRSEPWIVHLAIKLMLGSPDVLALLDTERYPFSAEQPPLAVRAQLYHYDFTRLDTPWAAPIPNVQLVQQNRSRLEALAPGELKAQAEGYGLASVVDIGADALESASGACCGAECSSHLCGDFSPSARARGACVRTSLTRW